MSRSPRAASPRPLLPRLLRQQVIFRRYWIGQTISLFGDQVTLIALPLTAVLVLHADAAQMGFLSAAAWLPYLLFSFAAGAFVDRMGKRRRTMIVADIGRALVLASIPVTYALHVLSLAQLFATAFVAGTLATFFTVSQSSLFISIVPRDDYVEANSLLYGSRAFSFAAGPSVGGFITQLVSAPAAIVADALSFLGSALFLLRIKPVEAPPARGEPRALSAGARFILRSPVVRPALVTSATLNLFNLGFSALFTIFAVDALHVQPAALGLILAAGAIGSVLGAVFTSRVSRKMGIGPAYIVGCVVFTVPLLLVPFAGGPMPLILTMLFCAEFISGFGLMLLDISVGAIFAAVIPHAMRSRVQGAYSTVNFGVRPLGSVMGGLLGASLGLRTGVLITAAGAALAFVFALRPAITSMRVLPAQ